jgi:hypothetical protein
MVLPIHCSGSGHTLNGFSYPLTRVVLAIPRDSFHNRSAMVLAAPCNQSFELRLVLVAASNVSSCPRDSSSSLRNGFHLASAMVLAAPAVVLAAPE